MDAEPSATSKTITVTCPHCRKESVIQVTIAGKKDNYSIECPHPDCNKPFMRQLAGKIIDGPHPK